MCQIWLRSDGRVEKNGGVQTDRQRDTAALYSRYVCVLTCDTTKKRCKQDEDVEMDVWCDMARHDQVQIQTHSAVGMMAVQEWSERKDD